MHYNKTTRLNIALWCNMICRQRDRRHLENTGGRIIRETKTLSWFRHTRKGGIQVTESVPHTVEKRYPDSG
jgi:hypothetical protein